MSDPLGREVDRVSVRVLPNTRRFMPDLQKFLERVETRVQVEIPTTLDTSGLMREAQAAVAAVEAGIGSVEVDAEARTAVAEAELDRVARDRTANINVDVDQKALDTLSSALGGSGGGGALSLLGMGGKGGMATLILAAAALPGIVVALEAIPAALVGIGAPIAAIVAGLDGIKDAFVDSGMATAIGELQQALSGTFRDGLTPIFREMLPVMAVVQEGLDNIADGLIQMTQFSVDALASPEGLATLDRIFDNISRSLETIAPAMEPAVAALLTLVDEGTTAFADISPVIAEVLEAFSQFVEWMGENGLLKDAFRQLFIALAIIAVALAVIFAVVLVVVGALGQLLRVIGETIPGVMEAIRNLPQQILDLVKDFPTLLYDAGRALIEGLAKGIRDAIPDLIPDAMDDLGKSLTFDIPGVDVPGIAHHPSRPDTSDDALGLNARTRSGVGVQVNIGTVQAHDYKDFMSQMRTREQRSQTDGMRV